MKQSISRKILFSSLIAFSLLSVFLFSGCEGGGGGGTSNDVGDNDPNLVACIGDSLTQGYNCEGDPYPSRLGGMSGKTVLNYGVGGTTSAYGASIISSVLGRKPGYVCILFGSNDAILSRDSTTTKENLRRVIALCKANSSVPILGTPPKMIGSHSLFDGNAATMASVIRELAKEEGVALVDLYKAFGDGTAYLVSDGLHLNDAGGDLIAKKFNSQL